MSVLADPTIGVRLGSAVVIIDSGNYATTNPGFIFTENQLTSIATDRMIGDHLGLHHSVITAIRKGVPDSRFESKIDRFASSYGYEPNLIRGDFRARKEKAWRLGTLDGPDRGLSGTRKTKANGWFSLRDRPATSPPVFSGLPYQFKKVGDSGIVTLAINVPVGLPQESIRDNRAQIRTIIEARSGWFYVTLDGRVPSSMSYDLKIGQRLLGSAGDDSGGGYRFDDMPFPGQPAGGPMLVNVELGLPAFAVDTYESYGSVYYLRQHPSTIRVLAGNDGAQMFAVYQQVGD